MKHILVNLISYRKYKMKIRSDIFSDNKGGTKSDYHWYA